MRLEEMFTEVFPAAMEVLLELIHHPHEWELQSMRRVKMQVNADILLFVLLHYFFLFTCFQMFRQLEVFLRTLSLPYLSSHSPESLAKGPIWFLIFTSRVPNWLKGI